MGQSRMIVHCSITKALNSKLNEHVYPFYDLTNPLIVKCTSLVGNVTKLKDLLDRFKSTFELNVAKEENRLVFKPGVNAQYDKVSEELENIKRESDEYLKVQSKHFGIACYYAFPRKITYELVIKKKSKKKPGKEYEILSSGETITRCHTTTTRSFEKRYYAAKDLEKKILTDIELPFISEVNELRFQWREIIHNLSILDCLMSLAEYARTNEVCVPIIYDDTDEEEMAIEVKDALHPCIKVENFVKNDISLATDGTAPIMILTGPNMGGKSTLMRQLGVVVVMAQIGCHVPAESCRLTMVDRIFTRLGARDDIVTGQSTFYVELSETAVMLNQASPYCLVLLDELGRGTSTYDGMAIAASVVDALVRKKCRAIFSTHYHSLIDCLEDKERVFTAHMACMEENEEHKKIKFLYKVRHGGSLKSYGLNCATLAGIPNFLLERATNIANKMKKIKKNKQLFKNIWTADNKISLKSYLEN